MKPATLIFLINEETNQICLAMKKRGFGVGKLNGYGGKIEKDETIAQGAIRELREESGTLVEEQDLEQVAELDFLFPSDKEWNQNVTVYIARRWVGNPVETEEMKPKWTEIHNIPYSIMWDDDILWLPRVLNGEKVYGKFMFDEKNKIMEHEIRSLSESYMPPLK